MQDISKCSLNVLAIEVSIVHHIIMKASWRSKEEPSGNLKALYNIVYCLDMSSPWCDPQNHDFGDSKDHAIDATLDL